MNDFRGTLASAKRGDEEAFARIWRAFQPGLLRYLRVKASTVSEDLAADTWLRVMRSLPTFEGDENCFRAWLYTTARNRLTDWYRGRDRRPEPSEIATVAALPAANDVEAEAAEHSSTETALGLIGQLPPDQAEAVMLRVVVGPRSRIGGEDDGTDSRIGPCALSSWIASVGGYAQRGPICIGRKGSEAGSGARVGHHDHGGTIMGRQPGTASAWLI